MRTYVLVHGAWGGSQSWRGFASLLWRAGHEVFTPSLTGLGERTHLARADTNLSTHIQDVIGCIEYNQLQNIVLVGHSYGGMVVTGVADKIPERISHLVYEDAFVPSDGESCWPREMIERNLTPDGLGILRQGVLNGAGSVATAVEGSAFFSPQPRGTYEEPVRLTVPLEDRAFTRTYVKAIGNPRPADKDRTGKFWEAAERLSVHPAWKYYEFPCGHVMHRELPKQFAGLLLALAED